MRLDLVVIAILLTAPVDVAHAQSGASGCPDLYRELGTLTGARTGWPNFKDPVERAKAIETLGLGKFAQEEDPLHAMLNSLHSEKNPEYAPTRKRMYFNLLARYGYVVAKANGARFFHGSNSASLVSVMKTRGGPLGLVPTGQLLEKGAVPFSGELLPGISEGGVNKSNLSVTPFNYLDLAMQYAVMDGKYSPEVSRKNIAKFKDLIKKFEGSNDDYMARAAANRVEIEQKRIAQWERLEPLERELIERDFPVLYGIRRLPNQKPEKGIPTRVGTWEFLIPDGVKPKEIVSIFVPADQVAFVRDHLAVGTDIEVSPIEPVLSRAMSTGRFRDLFSKGISEND